jgi:transaldolase
MSSESYLEWLARYTRTDWWCDSGAPEEVDAAIKMGAVGVTTNPVLCYRALEANSSRWKSQIKQALSIREPEQKAEELVRVVVVQAAKKLLPIFECSGGSNGYVCAQVNPALASDTEGMIGMAERFHSWAPNIAVKLPVTAAGLRALEICCSMGITVTATVSFTVPQVVEVAESHLRGIEEADKLGRVAGKCFAAIMVGRLDEKPIIYEACAPINISATVPHSAL